MGLRELQEYQESVNAKSRPNLPNSRYCQCRLPIQATDSASPFDGDPKLGMGGRPTPETFSGNALELGPADKPGMQHRQSSQRAGAQDDPAVHQFAPTTLRLSPPRGSWSSTIRRSRGLAKQQASPIARKIEKF